MLSIQLSKSSAERALGDRPKMTTVELTEFETFDFSTFVWLYMAFGVITVAVSAALKARY